MKLFPVILVFPTSKILKWQLIYQQSRENVFCLYRYKFHWCTWTAYGKGNDIQASEKSSRNQENKWWWTATHRGWYRVSKRFGVFLQIEATGHGQVKIKKVMIVSGTMSAVDINRMPNNRARYTITKRMPREWNYHWQYRSFLNLFPLTSRTTNNYSRTDNTKRILEHKDDAEATPRTMRQSKATLEG